MKRLASIAAMAVLFSAGAVADNWDANPGEGRADFLVKFKGEVPKRCEMVADSSLKEIDFDLTQKSDKKTFAFKTWCNSYGTKGIVLIDPYGFKNSNGNEIPMHYSFADGSSVKDGNTPVMEARIVQKVDISNDIDKKMSAKHKLTIQSKPQKGAAWGEYSGSMYVSLFHM
ncbi:hypothetical protein [Vibrio alfacsensis]|uniref:hypothetical protein n=1 Tax=Vibrio alfacsensis TaxID=1074311 RepID=UPI001BEE41FD|nr:hypothetical protein [Vibrio alfacsensis]WQE78509.1 hypothetical protein SO574_15280 [Vibrio alfacsensis]BCN26353.1 hypothetical protein VYA_35450 [Vibrio alfacsensis]